MVAQVDLNQVVYALSDALDLVGIDDTHHGKRVAFMAVKCAEVLGLDEDDTHDLFLGGMIHDCGVSSTDMHLGLVTNMERPDEAAHCVSGSQMMNAFPPLAHLGPVLLYHHTHWDKLAGVKISDKDKLKANLIFLVDRVDALHAMSQESDDLLARKGVLERLQKYSGSFFMPELVEALVVAASNEAFWLAQDENVLMDQLQVMLLNEKPLRMDMDQLRALARMFAGVVDVKSAFTAEHSIGVANLSVLLAGMVGIDEAKMGEIEIAALLHDLGKLRVPDEILDKPGPLDDQERARIMRHSFDTFQILNHVEGFKNIAQWAGFHHETVCGGETGYPFHIEGRNFPEEARIIAVADVFQALVQDRPYRAGMSSTEALVVLKEMAGKEHLDETLVGLVETNLDTCFEAARNMAHPA